MKRFLQQLRRWSAVAFGTRSRIDLAPYEEILQLCSRTLSIDDLLRLIPERVCGALQLASFNIFLREESAYVLRGGATEDLGHFSFFASSATVLRMRRSRKLAPFVQENAGKGRPDGWQMLAEHYELDLLRALEAEFLLPLDGRTGLVGFITMGTRTHRSFSPSELVFLRDLGPQMGRGIETAQMVSTMSRQAVERARVDRELALARDVQERLLPRSLPAVPGIAATAVYRSAEQVGGDYYDLFTTGSGLLCMVVADVSGKGIAAALLMAALRATLHALVSEATDSLAALVKRLSSLLYSASLDNRYATLFLCTYNPHDYHFTYVNAGHNPPFLLRNDGRIERLTQGGTVVGLMPDASYETETLTLAPGEALFTYTDGVTEATNLAGLEWGEEGLQAAIVHLASQREENSRSDAEEILRELDTYTAGTPQGDDITLLALRRQNVAS